jgi:glucose/arabinose dehydrogenase
MMRRTIAVTVSLVVVLAVAGPAGAVRPSRGHPAPPSGSNAGIGAQLVVGGLDYPAAFTFAPDGRIFYGERFTGEIRIYDPGSGSNTLFATIPDLSTQGEQGLLGLALHPQYPTAPFVFAYATRVSKDGSLRNQIIRLFDDGGSGTFPKIIFSSDTVAGAYHDGGRILFGPDDSLYAIVGEGHSPGNAQDLTNYAGKILRMTDRGRPAPGNPNPRKLTFAYGIRNSYGFTFDPVTSLLWETENGPACNDEINLVQSGKNYGWGPTQTCSTPPPPPGNTNQDGPNPVFPLSWFTPTIAPVGDAFCTGCGLTGSEGTLFFGAYNTSQIRRAVLTPDRMGISSITTVYTHSSSPLSMEVGIDAALYFSEQGGIYKLVQT